MAATGFVFILRLITLLSAESRCRLFRDWFFRQFAGRHEKDCAKAKLRLPKQESTKLAKPAFAAKLTPTGISAATATFSWHAISLLELQKGRLIWSVTTARRSPSSRGA